MAETVKFPKHSIPLLFILVISSVSCLKFGIVVNAHSVRHGWGWPSTSTTTSRPAVVKHCPPGFYWSLVLERCWYKNYNYNQGRFTPTSRQRPMNNGWGWMSTSTTTTSRPKKQPACPYGLYWSNVLERCWEYENAYLTDSEEAAIGHYVGQENKKHGPGWTPSTTTSTPRPKVKYGCPEGQYWSTVAGACRTISAASYAGPVQVYTSSSCGGGCGRGSYCDRARNECRRRRRI